jgi:hypothetical protein
VDNVTPQPLLSPVINRYPLYRSLDGPQGMAGLVQKKITYAGIRSPDRQARSEPLYGLRCLAQIYFPFGDF